MFHLLIQTFLSSIVIVVVIAAPEYSAVLSQRSGVALLAHRQQEQDWLPSGPPAHCPFQPTDARRQHCLYTAGTASRVD